MANCSDKDRPVDNNGHFLRDHSHQTTADRQPFRGKDGGRSRKQSHRDGTRHR